MSTERKVIRGLAVSTLALTASCIGFRGPEDLRHELARSAGVRLSKEAGVSVNRFGVMLVRWFTPEDEIPLKGVRNVQVGVYAVEGPRAGRDARRPLELPPLVGWQEVVRVRDEGEDVFVLVREENQIIRGLLVVVAEEDEWVLVRVRGKLDRTLESAMEMAFDHADRPELYGPAVADFHKRRQTDEPEVEARGRGAPGEPRRG